MSSQPAQGTTAGRRTQSSEEVRAAYNQRLDDQVTKALNAFRDVVSCCEIQDKATNARTDFQSQVEVANLAKAADELLRLVSDLKIAVIVQEFPERHMECMVMRNVYDQETRHSLSDMGELLGNVSNALSKLEKHYYASTTRWVSNVPE